MPHHTDTFALYYNQRLLQKLGIEAPDQPGQELVRGRSSSTSPAT